MKKLMFIALLVSLGMSSIVVQSQAALADALTTIELETPVHFLAPDGSNVLIEAGTYSVEPAEEWIRIMFGERYDAQLIEASKSTHELELEQPMAMSVAGEADNEQDNHYVMLLLPGGKSLEATGTYSGIRARGFFQNTFNRMKKTAKNTYKKARRTVTGGSGQWTKLSQAASAAARTEALNWLRQAYIDSRKCKVQAQSAIGIPGVLKSRYTFQGKIAKALKAAGASQHIAQGWDKAFKESWEQWAKNVEIPGIPFYPAFLHYPGPKAPPMPNVPVALGGLLSKGVAAMSPHKLSQKVLANIGTRAKYQKAKNAVRAFATDLGGRFASCMGGCQLMNVMGSGPIPSFAPPLVPVGPVMNGTCRGGVISHTGGFESP